MPRILMFAGALAFLAAGCATSAETEHRAEIHDARAHNDAAYENYEAAAAEKREADRLHAKAAAERANEAANGEVVPVAEPPAASELPPPAPVPPPPPAPVP